MRRMKCNWCNKKGISLNINSCYLWGGEITSIFFSFLVFYTARVSMVEMRDGSVLETRWYSSKEGDPVSSCGSFTQSYQRSSDSLCRHGGKYLQIKRTGPPFQSRSTVYNRETWAGLTWCPWWSAEGWKMWLNNWVKDRKIWNLFCS